MLGEQLFTLIMYSEIKKHKQKLKGLSNHSKGINAFIVAYNEHQHGLQLLFIVYLFVFLFKIILKQ